MNSCCNRLRHDEGYRGLGNRETSNKGSVSEIKSATLHKKLDVESEGHALG